MTTQSDFTELCASPSGILLETSSVLIGARQEFEGAQGRIIVYIGNLSKAPLSNVHVRFDPGDHLRIQREATEGLLEHEGCTVAKGTQAKLTLLIEVLAPFEDGPALRVFFRTGDGVSHEHFLRLPILVTCFMTPVKLDLQTFRSQWHALESHECRIILKSVPANPSYMKHIAEIIQKLNLERCQACDDTPWSVSGAGVFHTAAKDVNGNKVDVQCLVRIEADHQHRAVR